MKAVKYILALVLVLTLTVPAMAGNGPGGPGGGGGGTPDIPDTGELYGDLYVILRDEDGVPMLSADGCIQPIAAITDEAIIVTIDGEVTIYAEAGEPFGLPTYTDTAGDLVECELTEEMADWVQAVDFGRLNLGRSPESVIAHAFDEAVNKMNAATAMKLDPAGRLVLTLPDTETVDPNDTVDKTIDAPAENLALYIEMMTDGDWITEDTAVTVKGGRPGDKGPPEGDGPSTEPRPVLNASAIALLSALGFTNLGVHVEDWSLNNDELVLAASLLAAAADKTGSMTLDKVVYINSIYGINQVTAEGTAYFDFGAFSYGYTEDTGRNATFSSRWVEECIGEGLPGPGFAWVLQPREFVLADTDPVTEESYVELGFYKTCMEILGHVNNPPDPNNPDWVETNSVHFTDMVEAYTTVKDSYGNDLAYDFIDNVRGFAQAADDALKVIEYIHNYKVPEDLYGLFPAWSE